MDVYNFKWITDMFGGVFIMLFTAAITAPFINPVRDFGAGVWMFVLNHMKNTPSFKKGTKFLNIIHSGDDFGPCKIYKVDFWNVYLELETGGILILKKRYFKLAIKILEECYLTEDMMCDL